MLKTSKKKKKKKERNRIKNISIPNNSLHIIKCYNMLKTLFDTDNYQRSRIRKIRYI